MIFPLAAPGFVAGASLVFVKVFDDLGTPLVLNVTNMLAPQAYLRITQVGLEDPLGYVISVIMIAFSILALWLSVRAGLIASAVAGGILLFLLAAASSNTALLAKHYPLLLGLNAALAALLAALVAWQIRTLWRAYREKAFGSRLTVRLLLLLALMAVVPGALVYTVSVQFLSKSIESWFDVKVDARGCHLRLIPEIPSRSRFPNAFITTLLSWTSEKITKAIPIESTSQSRAGVGMNCSRTM